MLKIAIPVLSVLSSQLAESYYCGQLGFQLKFTYRPDPIKNDPCYFGVYRDSAVVHLSSFPGDGTAGHSQIQILVDDIDSLYEELAKRGVDNLEKPIDQDWGNREIYLKDPDGNLICFAKQ